MNPSLYSHLKWYAKKTRKMFLKCNGKLYYAKPEYYPDIWTIKEIIPKEIPDYIEEE